jgi:hypothetical protein
MRRAPQIGSKVMIRTRTGSYTTTTHEKKIIGKIDFAKCRSGKVKAIHRKASGKLRWIEVEMDPPNFGIFSFLLNELEPSE